ncbi:hypothetical protein EJB05_53897, partial [Eragrostis curvula]
LPSNDQAVTGPDLTNPPARWPPPRTERKTLAPASRRRLLRSLAGARFHLPRGSTPPRSAATLKRSRRPSSAPMAMAQRAMGLLRRSFGLTAPPAQRALSTSAAAPAAEGAVATAEAVAKEVKRRKKKNLFDVVQFLPGWGVGYKVAKTTWRDVSYQITKINLYKDGRHGKAWGIRYKAGVQAADAPIRISGVNKRGWKYIKESQKKLQEAPKVETPAVAA